MVFKLRNSIVVKENTLNKCMYGGILKHGRSHKEFFEWSMNSYKYVSILDNNTNKN